MGFFSWNCNVCKHPMLSRHASNSINHWMVRVVVIEAHTGKLLRGEYDGYGRVDDREIHLGAWRDNHGLENDPTCYHEACWLKVGKPNSDKPSSSSRDQGYFFGDEHDVGPPTTKLEE